MAEFIFSLQPGIGIYFLFCFRSGPGRPFSFISKHYFRAALPHLRADPYIHLLSFI